MLQKFNEIWLEESPVIYEIVCAIQDDIIPTLLEEYPEDLVQDANGDIQLEYDTATELENNYDDA